MSDALDNAMLDSISPNQDLNASSIQNYEKYKVIKSQNHTLTFPMDS